MVDYLKKPCLANHNYSPLERYEYIFTIGCFDRFHVAHETMLNYLKEHCKTLVVGLHDNVSIGKIKNLDPDTIQPYQIREANVLHYADYCFKIDSTDPTSAFKGTIEDDPRLTHSNPSGYMTSSCFVRADDNINFPAKDYVSKIMPIKFLKYNQTVSSTHIRSNNDSAIFNRLLERVAKTLESEGIPFYLDTGTLLGCIRDGKLIDGDTDIDLSIHHSYWDRLATIDWSQYHLIPSRVLDQEGIVSVHFPGHPELYCDIYRQPAFPLTTKTILNGVTYSIPVNPTLYLQLLYGDNWTVPSKEHADWVFHRGNGLATSRYKVHWDLSFPIKKMDF